MTDNFLDQNCMPQLDHETMDKICSRSLESGHDWPCNSSQQYTVDENEKWSSWVSLAWFAI